MSIKKTNLRIAILFRNRMVSDKNFSKSTLRAGMEPSCEIPLAPLGFPEGFSVFKREGGDCHSLYVTDQMGGRVQLKGKMHEFSTLSETWAKAVGTEKVERADGKSVSAKVYRIDLTSDDWGIIQIGESDVVFQYTVPKAAIRRAATLGGPRGVAVGLTAALFSVLGVAFLLSLLAQGALLFWALWTDDTERQLGFAQLDERWVEILTSADEKEEKPEVIQETVEVEVDETVETTADDQRFSEADPEDPETTFLDIDTRVIEKIDKPVGIQAALSSSMFGSGGAQSLFGGGGNFGDAMDQLAIGDGEGFGSGYGYGGMGGIGRGAGGGGFGSGRIGGLADRDIATSKGSGKGLGQKAQAKVRPKVKFEAPKQGEFCKASNISQVVQKSASSIRNCYERQLLAEPNLSGKIVMTWKVMLDGTVKDVFVRTTTMNNDKVEKCMERALSRLRFDKPDGGICIIEFPFVFSPSD